MSWSGFKKNVNRATTQVMMKTGHVEKTSDRQYEVEERRYRTLESASLRLQKEAKGYLDSLRAMTASQMRIAETIDAFYGDSGARDGVSRSYKQAVEDLDAETVKALDGPYRTTVLEPINRFCAYFPDVNECIKKRNHKMLDYDAMRSKVKKLTEKPDKDPGKLPRTEKETEMVSDDDLLLQHPSRRNRPRIFTLEEILREDRVDLTVPSPPKVLRRPGIIAHRYGDLGRHLSAIHPPSKSPSGAKQTSPPPRPSNVSSGSTDDSSQHSVSTTSSSSTVVRVGKGGSSTLSPRLESPVFPAKRPQPRSTSSPQPSLVDPLIMTTTSSPVGLGIKQSRFPSQPLGRATGAAISDTQAHEHRLYQLPITSLAHQPTPFFNPSDLEDIMAPLRAEFIEREANALAQAKAAYEQLNEQLTNELPQLIDLRVPYLDPSFEALVKIQLRFCAEAYSRMAQVQQYLNASTRDQYASGDLDARVEEVLGQIRELSIAGTV